MAGVCAVADGVERCGFDDGGVHGRGALRSRVASLSFLSSLSFLVAEAAGDWRRPGFPLGWRASSGGEDIVRAFLKPFALVRFLLASR